MLEDAAGIRRVVLACGTVDLRKGIDGLAMIIANSHFLRTAGPYFPDSPGHIKRTAWDISRAEGTPPY